MPNLYTLFVCLFSMCVLNCCINRIVSDSMQGKNPGKNDPGRNYQGTNQGKNDPVKNDPDENPGSNDPGKNNPGTHLG